MIDERAKIIDKAKKLKELAERGIDGEKETAQRMYDAYKKKHKLTDEDINGHKYTDDFINEFSKMSDQELLEFIGKSLIMLGVGLIFSFLSDLTDDDKNSRAKRNSDNTKTANKLTKVFYQISKNKKKEKEDEDNKDTENSPIELLLELNNILDEENKQNKIKKNDV